jgi:phosphoribosylanthranilate isomerase
MTETAALDGGGGSKPSRPQVKVCGVTTVYDALLAVHLGADYLGLNFYPPSPRFVSPPKAVEIAAAVRRLAPTLPLVGVFVNADAETLWAIDAVVGLDLLQFHGDETAAEVAPYAHRALKAFRVQDQLVDEDLEGWEDVWGWLVDSRHPQLYGGSGESWDFASLQRSGDATMGRRLFIAGGLGPGNVRQAIEAAQPWGIDLCSGIESTPGHKDPQLLRQLFEEIQHG